MAIRTVCVTGSREWTDGAPIRAALEEAKRDGAVLLIHGACAGTEGALPDGTKVWLPGADRLADAIGKAIGLQVVPFPADWNKHGRRAGPIRNQRMIDEGKPDRVYAFPLGASRGTRDCMRRAKDAGIPVFEWCGCRFKAA